MSHYITLSTYGNCTRLLKLISSWKSVVLTNKVGKNCRYFVGVFNKTIIPIALVGDEMVISNSYPMRTRGIIVKYYIESERAKPYVNNINNKLYLLPLAIRITVILQQKFETHDVTICNNKTRSFTDLHYLFVRVSQKRNLIPVVNFLLCYLQ